MNKFSHYSSDGASVMVDVSDKKITSRVAKASGFVKINLETIKLIEQQLLPKGNLFEVAKTAGVLAAKQTANLIPMCHPLILEYIEVTVTLDQEREGVAINSEIRLQGKTGAEMEALTAVSVAALTVYDMCKAVDKKMVIEDLKLIEKKGGKSDFIDQV